MMMNELNTVVLDRLYNSTIIFDVKSQEEEPYEWRDKPFSKPVTPHSVIAPDDPCPCGSKKKYRECHGRSIHGNNIVRRRR
jgi:uncharacterized protein YecA (UPF0149 family)